MGGDDLKVVPLSGTLRRGSRYYDNSFYIILNHFMTLLMQ